MKLARLEGLEHRDKTGLQLPHEAFGKVSPSAAPDGRKRREKGPWAVGHVFLVGFIECRARSFSSFLVF